MYNVFSISICRLLCESKTYAPSLTVCGDGSLTSQSFPIGQMDILQASHNVSVDLVEENNRHFSYECDHCVLCFFLFYLWLIKAKELFGLTLKSFFSLH